MNPAHKLLNQIWNEKNLVKADDSTDEIVRKHKLFKAITEAIDTHQLERGRDFGGTEEDSIYNDLSECEEILFERAVMRHNRDAVQYIMDGNVNGLFWIEQQLSKAKAVYQALKEEIEYPPLEVIKTLELLKEIVPQDYPDSDEHEGE